MNEEWPWRSLREDIRIYAKDEIPLLSEEDLEWIKSNPVDVIWLISLAVKNRHPGSYLATLSTKSLEIVQKFLYTNLSHAEIKISDAAAKLANAPTAPKENVNIDIYLLTSADLGIKEMVEYSAFIDKAALCGFTTLDTQTALLSAIKLGDKYNWISFASSPSNIYHFCFFKENGNKYLDVRNIGPSVRIGINQRWIFARKR